MIKSLLCVFIVSMLAACTDSVVPEPREWVGGEYAEAANENPFLNGGLNPKYEGEATGLLGVITEIVSTKSLPIYKLNVGIEGIDHIWISTVGKISGGDINVGDVFIFKGIISRTAITDPSGELGELTNSEMHLMAVEVEKGTLRKGAVADQ